MKKIILLATFLATYLLSNAQETNSKIKFGAKAGLNISSASVDRGYGTDISSFIGVHIGGFANFKLISLTKKKNFKKSIFVTIPKNKTLTIN